MQLTGILKKAGMTAFQYGTHLLRSGGTTYALESKGLRLDRFVGKNVSITGQKVNGYPLEGGPELIRVKSIEEV